MTYRPGTLLFLETKLEELIKLIGKLPVLNPADDWHDKRDRSVAPGRCVRDRAAGDHTC